MLLLAVFVPEVVRFAGVPVGERERTPIRNPEEVALLRQIGTARPEVFRCQTCWLGGMERDFKMYPEQSGHGERMHDAYHSLSRISPADHSPPGTVCWLAAYRGSGSTVGL